MDKDMYFGDLVYAYRGATPDLWRTGLLYTKIGTYGEEITLHHHLVIFKKSDGKYDFSSQEEAEEFSASIHPYVRGRKTWGYYEVYLLPECTRAGIEIDVSLGMDILAPCHALNFLAMTLEWMRLIEEKKDEV